MQVHQNCELRSAVLFLSFGTPQSKTALIPYLTSIRHGRVPSEQDVQSLQARYDMIGQWQNESLRTMGQQQKAALQQALPTMKVYDAYLHIPHSIEQAIETIVSDKYTSIIAIVTSPFYADMGTGAYERKLNSIVASYPQLTVRWVRSWWQYNGFTDYWCHAIDSLQDNDDESCYIFSAHSVPIEHVGQYADEIQQAASQIADAVGLYRWRVAFQSAPPRGRWLTPTIEDVIQEELSQNSKRIICVPFGFVSDHVEVLYDNDVVCKNQIVSGGAQYERVAMPNTDPRFIQAMASAIAERMHK